MFGCGINTGVCEAETHHRYTSWFVDSKVKFAIVPFSSMVSLVSPPPYVSSYGAEIYQISNSVLHLQNVKIFFQCSKSLNKGTYSYRTSGRDERRACLFILYFQF